MHISTTFTGTPRACLDHFGGVCRSYHPAGYGTMITRIVDCASGRDAFGADLERLAETKPETELTITIGRSDSCD